MQSQKSEGRPLAADALQCSSPNLPVRSNEPANTIPVREIALPTGRRAFLAVTTAVLAGAIPATAALAANHDNPDAALFAACRKFDVAEDARDALHSHDDYDDDEAGRLCHLSHQAYKAAMAVPAHSLSGLRAKIEIMNRWIPGAGEIVAGQKPWGGKETDWASVDVQDDDWRALVGDIQRVTEGAASVPIPKGAPVERNPDAKVLAAVSEYLRIDGRETAIIREAEHKHGCCAYEKHPDYREAYQIAHEQVDEALIQLCQMESRTPKGVYAKFRLLDQSVSGGVENYPLDMGDDESLLASIRRDLARLSGERT